MGLMFARRRLEAIKEHEANKAQAHEKNHAAAKEKSAPAKSAPKPKEPKKDADSSGAK